MAFKGGMCMTCGEPFEKCHCFVNAVLLESRAIYKVADTCKTDNGIKDSGSRAIFSTGAQRDRQQGKGLPSLIPGFVVWLVSRIYEDGAAKYEPRNWEKGMALSNYIDSAERHLMKLKAGLREEPHATMVIWNMMGYVFTSVLIKMGLRPKELNDMPNQFNVDPQAIAESLSEYEYTSMETFLGAKLTQEKNNE